MEKRAVLAIVLSLVVVVLWSIFFAPAPLPPPSEVSEPAPSEPPAGVGTPQPAAPVSPGLVSSTVPTSERPPGAPPAQEVLVTVDTGVARFTLTSQGASVRAVQLQAYHTTLAKGAPPIEIAPVPGSTTLPLHAELSMEQRVIALGQVVFTPSQTEVTLSASQPEGTVAFRGDLGNGRTVHRLYRFHHTNYTFEVSTWVEGLQPPVGSSMFLLWGPGLLRHTDDVNRQGQTGEHPRSYVSGKVLHEAPKKPGESQIEQGQVAWTALADTYFAAVLMPREPAGDAVMARRLDGDTLEVGLRTPLTRPMLQFLRLLNGLVHNYAVTIILATILIKIAFWPLTQTSYKSMQAM